MKIGSRIYVSAGSAMTLTPYEQQCWNESGHDGKFGRSWWYWMPRAHWFGNPFCRHLVDFGASWLCYFFFVNIYLWPRRAMDQMNDCKTAVNHGS